MIKLGVIGLSEGNGHPYSWSAIFNGYDECEMKKCPFPVIYEYLSQQVFPDDFIQNAKVTHIWTQDKNLSENIAKASNIDHVVEDYVDMLGNVDAILLARDDAENHYKVASFFLKERLPIYIDKPLAHTVEDANKLFNLEQYEGQIFTCSALRYANELYLTDEDKRRVGNIKEIVAKTPKNWDKYAIHIIEPLSEYIKKEKISDIKVKKDNKNNITVKFLYDGKITVSLSSLGKVNEPISISYIGEKSIEIKEFKDAFSAFKKALENFILSIKEHRRIISTDETLDVINIVEKGIITLRGKE